MNKQREGPLNIHGLAKDSTENNKHQVTQTQL